MDMRVAGRSDAVREQQGATRELGASARKGAPREGRISAIQVRTNGRMLGAPREGRISAQRGLTLVEIMVVLAIVGAITVAMAPAIGSIFGARLVGSCNRLSGMVRYAYNLATLTGKVHRIVVNVGEGTYVVEEVEQKGECQGVDLLDEDKKDSGPDLSGRKGAVAEGEETPEEGEGEAVVGGKEVVDKRVRKETLPGGVKFTGILTKHNKAVVEDGTESIYFFPDGTAEKALVWLTDGEDTFTVEVKALQGTGMVHAEELDSKELSKK